jgi:hypothetical protein
VLSNYAVKNRKNRRKTRSYCGPATPSAAAKAADTGSGHCEPSTMGCPLFGAKAGVRWSRRNFAFRTVADISDGDHQTDRIEFPLTICCEPDRDGEVIQTRCSKARTCLVGEKTV